MADDDFEKGLIVDAKSHLKKATGAHVLGFPGDSKKLMDLALGEMETSIALSRWKKEPPDPAPVRNYLRTMSWFGAYGLVLKADNERLRQFADREGIRVVVWQNQSDYEFYGHTYAVKPDQMIVFVPPMGSKGLSKIKAFYREFSPTNSGELIK